MRPVSFEQAKAMYVHRFTMEHQPAWSRKPCSPSWHYAPQFASDREWYDLGRFNEERGEGWRDTGMISGEPTWPLGERLDVPFSLAVLRPKPTSRDLYKQAVAIAKRAEKERDRAITKAKEEVDEAWERAEALLAALTP